MDKLVKFFITASINSLRGSQFLLVFVALACVIYFILSFFITSFPEPVQIFFGTIYNIQSLVYDPKNSPFNVDFTLVTFAVEMGITAALLVYVQEFLIDFEKSFEKVSKYNARRYEKKFNKQLEKNAKWESSKSSNNFAILYKIDMVQTSREVLFNEKNVVDISAKINEYQQSLKNLLCGQFGAIAQPVGNSFVLNFSDIKLCNKVFNSIFEFQAKSMEEMASCKIKLNVLSAVCIVEKKNNKEEYLPKLEKLVSIAKPNKIMTLADFKAKYETLKEQAFTAVGLGTYALGDALIDVYTLEK